MGNLRTALLSWLITRLQGGEWLLRIDDLDTPRIRPGAEASIQEDLRWLGLFWDGPVLRQSERRGLYATVLSALRRSGQLYPCRCSRRMLADVSAPHGRSGVYPGFAVLAPVGAWRMNACRVGGASTGRSASGRVKPLRRLDGFKEVAMWSCAGRMASWPITWRPPSMSGLSALLMWFEAWISGQPPDRRLFSSVWALSRPLLASLWLDGQGQRLSKRDGGQGLPLGRRRDWGPMP